MGPRRILCIMSQSLNRRAFLAALSAVSAAWAGGKAKNASVNKDPYVPSFLHPNDRWVVLRGDKGFLYELVDLETGQRVQTLFESQCDTSSAQPEIQFDPSGRYLVITFNSQVSHSTLKRWDLEDNFDVLGFCPQINSDNASYPLGAKFNSERGYPADDAPAATLPAPGGILRTPEYDWRLSDFRLLTRRTTKLPMPPALSVRLASVATRNRGDWEVDGPADEAQVRQIRSRRKPELIVKMSDRPLHWGYGENWRGQDVCLARRRDNNHVLVWSGFSIVREINPASGKVIRCISGSMPQTGLLAFGSTRASLYASRSLDRPFRWNRNGRATQVPSETSGVEVRVVPPGTRIGPSPEVPRYPVPTRGTRALACNAQGLAIGMDNGDLWHGLARNPDGGPWFKIGHHEDVVRALAFVPNRPWLLSGARDGGLSIWNLDTKALLKQLSPHGSRVNAAAVHSVDSAATCGPDGIRLWNLDTGNLRRHLETMGAWVSDVALSPDGKHVAGALLDGTLRMWNVETGALIWSAKAEAGWCAALAFHPDGKRLVAGYELGQIVDWNAETGIRLAKVMVVGEATFQKGSRPVHALTWSADGQALAVAFGDAVRVYDRNLHSSEEPGWLLGLDWEDEFT